MAVGVAKWLPVYAQVLQPSPIALRHIPLGSGDLERHLEMRRVPKKAVSVNAKHLPWRCARIKTSAGGR